MFDLINITKSYKIKNINTLNKSLILYKNCLKIMSKKGFDKFETENLYPVRWSSKKDQFVVDFRTQKKRDIDGICLNNLSFFYNPEEIINKDISFILNSLNLIKDNILWDDIKIKKNENKFLAITKTKDNFFIFRGLYIFCHYKNRDGSFTTKNNRSILIDHSRETKNKICKLINNKHIIFYEREFIENYIDQFNKFKNILLNKKYKFSINNSDHTISLYDYMNTKFRSDLSSKDCRLSIQNKEIKYISDVDNILPYIIYDEFYDFLSQNKNVNYSFIIYDNILEKNLLFEKILNNNILKEKENKQNYNFYFGVF